MSWNTKFGDNIVTEWLPTWWTQMIMQKDAATVSTTQTVVDSGEHHADIDLKWTTATAHKPLSVWSGPQVWEGWKDHAADFNS
jgi:hypothetical protein